MNCASDCSPVVNITFDGISSDNTTTCKATLGSHAAWTLEALVMVGRVLYESRKGCCWGEGGHCWGAGKGVDH